jgi:hypothetical protein
MVQFEFQRRLHDPYETSRPANTDSPRQHQ